MHTKKAKRLNDNIKKRKILEFQGLVDITVSNIEEE
jgi:hypothetical protein